MKYAVLGVVSVLSLWACDVPRVAVSECIALLPWASATDTPWLWLRVVAALRPPSMPTPPPAKTSL